MKRIKLLTVGATLTAQGKDALDFSRYDRRISGLRTLYPAELLARVPEASRFATVEPDEDWANLDPQPSPGDAWTAVATRLQHLLEDDGVDGAVLVHGTNVLEETAYFLHLVLKTRKPVIVVGAQRPITALSTDGPLNVVAAVRTAASEEAAGRGVLVVLNDEIHSARDVTKSNTFRLHTFRSPSWGPIGVVDADRVVFHYRPERAHTMETPFSVSGLRAWPRVDIVYGHHFDDGALIDAAVALGARGLVAATAGAGSPAGMRTALEKALNRGVVVVRSSRVGSGRVLSDDNAAMPETIAAGDLNPQKARLLLQLGVMVTRDVATLRTYFETF
ncbi:MAG: asparaginase [Armatimonadetes bacterium]|nr:asparaginase [Armatimonadota bacterium]